MESPSGLACEVMRKRRRLRISLQIASTCRVAERVGLSVALARFVAVIVSSGEIVQVRVLGTFGLDVEDDALDPVLTLDAFIVEEVEPGHVLQAEPPADLVSQKGRRTTERALRFLSLLVVADARVIYARLLQVGRHLHAGDGEKPDARI